MCWVGKGWRKGVSSLIVSLALNKALGVASEEEATRLIVDHDESREGERHEPVAEEERAHVEGNVGAWDVDEDDGEDSLKQNTKVECHVLHALLEDGKLARLADEHIGPLHNHNGNKECCLAGVLQVLALVVSLTSAKQTIREDGWKERGGEAEKRQSRRPLILDTCHAWASDSQVVKQNTPKYYTGKDKD